MAPPDRDRPRPAKGSRPGEGSRRPAARPGRAPRQAAVDEPGPPGWGALARRGGRRLAEDDDGPGAPPPPVQGPRAPRDEDVWVQSDEVGTEARGAVHRGDRSPPRQRSEPASTSGDGRAARRARSDVELVKAVGASRAVRVAQRLKDGSRAFEREQFQEARRVLRPLAQEAPAVATVRELLGLTYYRLGQWKVATRELEAFRELTGSCEQHPVLADCYRALKRWRAVDDLWEELRAASPSASLVAEGRIVVAGSLADRGRMAEAIALLERGHRPVKRPLVHHLRVAYALADLRERSGDVPGARALFGWIVGRDPTFADAAERTASLG